MTRALKLRSMLFVPADSERKLAKAVDSPAEPATALTCDVSVAVTETAPGDPDSSNNTAAVTTAVS